MVVASFVGVMAQQDALPSRTLTIEGSYNPTVTEAGKMMPAPEKTRTVKTPESVSYLTSPNSFEGLSRSPMEVLATESDTVERERYTAIARLGYGLPNLHDGLLDIGWNMTQADRLRLSATTNGWNSVTQEEWRSKMFKSRVGAQYNHQFENALLGVGADWGFSRFNYMQGTMMSDDQLAASNLSMNTNQGSVSFFLRSDSTDCISFYLGGTLEWLGRSGFSLNGVEPTNKERLVRIQAGVSKELANGELRLDYNQKSVTYDWTGLYGAIYKGFTEFTLSPSWHYVGDGIKAQVGANVDIRTSAGKALLLSPQMGLDYELGSSLDLILRMTGGVEEYDMRTLASVSPYWSEEHRIKDGYKMVDICAGLNYSPLEWLAVQGKAGYSHTIDGLFQTKRDSLIVTSNLLQHNMDQLYVGINADMQFSDRTMLRMDFTYNHYLGRYERGILELKPILDANLFGKFNVAGMVDVMLSYRMMAFGSIEGSRMPMVNDLSLTGSYNLDSHWSCYATLKQIMGGDYYYYAGYRALKPGFLLGAIYRF